ncbi:dihydrodipicolinate synthase family protein [Treponema parvum]|uniref:Dihydrodipicolinate synthase family protein n=1 Tax=Treponema parvum TaxID=138851 RepID=A0A975F4L7_9SPIR|nr:dihydrodipicolinate synthase family protein [Treponema parvum]QTQ14282.1 dihydrodipicolinate synthase family protein [Treponema parvum]
MNGIYVASLTPFDRNDNFNPKALIALMERNLAEGAAGFFIGGSSAECFLLSHEERLVAFECAAAFKGRTNLVAHCGAIGTKEAIDFACNAKRMGYRHIAATPPLYYGFTPGEIARYYYDISKAVDMPVIVYNFPGNTKKEFDLNNPIYRELFSSDAIEGVKHTNQVVYQLERFLELNPKLWVLNGFDETMVAGLALGSQGSIGSTFNCMLPHYLKIYNAFNEGRIAEARAMQHKANNIMEAFCSVGLIPAVKYVVCKQGIDVGIARKPFGELPETAKSLIDRTLEENLIE